MITISRFLDALGLVAVLMIAAGSVDPAFAAVCPTPLRVPLPARSQGQGYPPLPLDMAPIGL